MKKDAPIAVSEMVKMDEPNQIIRIHKGRFKIKSEKITIDLDGEIFFKWFPKLSVEFKAIYEKKGFWNSYGLSGKILEVFIDDIKIGKCFITNHKFGKKNIIRGILIDNIIRGDKSIKADRFKFSVPNLKEFLGESVYYKLNNTYSRSRIAIKNEEFEIRMDKVIDFKKKIDRLKEHGGFQILYSGEIITQKPFSFDEISDLLDVLGQFLSFVNGKRLSPLFLTAFDKGRVLYEEFTGYRNHIYEYKFSWSNSFSTDYINDLFFRFYKLWLSNNNNKDFLKTIVHWYTEVNCNKGYAEGSLIMAQTALELLYNWFVVEEKQLIVDKDAERISAANKIRLLVSQLSLSYDIPPKFKDLEQFRKNEKLRDGIEAVVRIRNAIVHSQMNKRIELQEIQPNAIIQAVELSLWYIELSLLHILGFKDKYVSRCSEATWKGDDLETPPWAK